MASTRGTREVIEIPTTSARDVDGALLSGRVVLYGEGACLEPRDGDAYELVVVDRAEKVETAVVAATTMNPHGPTKTPPTADDLWQFSLKRGSGARVRLTCDKAGDVAVLLDVSATSAGVALQCRAPKLGVPAELRVVGSDGRVLATTPLHPDGEEYLGVIGPDLVDLEPGSVAAIYAASEGTAVPVCRRANDLARPNGAVQLPSARGGEAEKLVTSLRLLYQRNGALAIRRPNFHGDPA